MKSLSASAGVVLRRAPGGIASRPLHGAARDLHDAPPPPPEEDPTIQYAILCYDAEEVVCAWTKEQDDAAVAALDVVQKKLAQQGRLGPVARLMPTTTATTVRKGSEAIVLDGPFAETKEQLLGFFIVECASLEQAIEAAKDLAQASGSPGAFEVRPLRMLRLEGTAP